MRQIATFIVKKNVLSKPQSQHVVANKERCWCYLQHCSWYKRITSSLLMKLAEVCLSVYRVLLFQITTQKIRHLELQYCTFFTLLLYKLHELILLYFLPSCYILDNQVILPGKCFLPPTCPGTSFVKNICRTLPLFQKQTLPSFTDSCFIFVSVKRALYIAK